MAHALPELLQQARKLGCSWLNMDRELFTPALPDVVHAEGMRLGLWTVNTLEEMRRFAAAQVDALATDRPDLFAQL